MTLEQKQKRQGYAFGWIAEKIGINDGNFSRKLRHELPQEEKEKIFRIIDELKAGA